MRKKAWLFIALMLLMTILFAGCLGQSKNETGQEQKSQKDDAVVYLVQTPPPNMLKQLTAKEIDGFIAWEPFDTVAVRAGDGKYLFKSPDIWKNHPCCVLAVSQNFKDAKTVEAFTWAHVKAIRFINDPKNKDKVISYAAAFTGKDKTVVEQALKNITYVEYPAKDKFKEYYNSLEQDKLLKKSVSEIGFSDPDKFFAGFLQNSVYKDVSDKLARDPKWAPVPVLGSTKLRVGYINHDLHQLAIYVAEKEGYYQKIGLVTGRNYETKVYPNGVAVMEAFKAKDIDMAYLGGAPATLKRINDNIPIEIVAGANNEGSGLVVRSDLGINTIADLKGKTIAVPGMGTVQYTLLEKALKEKGLRPVIK
ncbi:MAG: ABC transporter substrate-binding protein [Eubacteriales bacterium]